MKAAIAYNEFISTRPGEALVETGTIESGYKNMSSVVRKYAPIR